MPGMSATVSMRDGKSNPKLLDQVRDAIRRKHYSLRTEQSYTDWGNASANSSSAT